MTSVKHKIKKFTNAVSDYISNSIDYTKSSSLGTDNIDFDKVINTGRMLFKDQGDNIATIKEYAAISMLAVQQGIGGKGMNPVSIWVDKKEKIFTCTTESVWRGRAANQKINPGDFTKRRFIRIGAMLWFAMYKRDKKRVGKGFYLTQGYSKNNFCLGYEFVVENPKLALKHLVVLYTVARDALAGTPKAGQEISFLKRAVKVAKRSLQNAGKNTSPSFQDVIDAIKRKEKASTLTSDI